MRTLVSTVLLTACTATPVLAPSAEAPEEHTDLRALSTIGPLMTGREVWGGGLTRLEAAWRPLDPARITPRAADAYAGTPSAPAELLGGLTGLTPNEAYGGAILDALDALDADRAPYGLAGLTAEQLYTGDALCEDPHYNTTFEADGAEWEVEIEVTGHVILTEAPTRLLDPISDVCTESLATNGGADCTDEEVQMFFPAGSDCEACLAEDGAYDRCVTEDRCAEEATRQVYGQLSGESRPGWYSVLLAENIVCAPDLRAPLLLLTNLEENEDLPSVFTYERIRALCAEHWWEEDGAPALACSTTSPEGDALWDVLPAHIVSYGPAGAASTRLAGRMGLFSSLGFADGTSAPLSYASTGFLGGVGAPAGVSINGWGLNPTATRPDGDTMERDFLAAVAMKSSTTITGIYVWPFQKNRCAAWSDADADGSSTCLEVSDWDPDWYEDGTVTWYDTGRAYPYPTLTLVSTGLPDPDLPGDFLVHVQGSEHLADEDWEGCDLEPFTPDRMPLLDYYPIEGDEPYASFDAETWRFDRPGDIRMGLLTNQRRDFCGFGLE
jgi:hypothetical protein